MLTPANSIKIRTNQCFDNFSSSAMPLHKDCLELRALVDMTPLNRTSSIDGVLRGDLVC